MEVPSTTPTWLSTRANSSLGIDITSRYILYKGYILLQWCQKSTRSHWFFSEFDTYLFYVCWRHIQIRFSLSSRWSNSLSQFCINGTLINIFELLYYWLQYPRTIHYLHTIIFAEIITDVLMSLLLSESVIYYILFVIFMLE